jgi:CDP-paratose 2-epimerase
MKILITGGAGFVGSSLAKLYKENHPNYEITIFDNLKRRGSEINLPVFKKMGVNFFHGDIRNQSDLEDITSNFDFILEASAEPSVHAGTGGQSPRYLLDTNLNGTLNCLEFARKKTGGMIFLSTSRVYSIPAIKQIQLQEALSRLEVSNEQLVPGISKNGISEMFPTVGSGFRSLYGTTKLASELFIEEYAQNFGFKAIINRSGVIAGKGQFGKTDQGIFTLWVARHIFKGKLSYTGFGGLGKQVRDILHPKDLFSLLEKQIQSISEWDGSVYNIGGGHSGSVSLLEYTKFCEEVTGNKIEIGSNPETALVDIPYYVSDSKKASDKFQWEIKIKPKQIVQEISDWINSDRVNLEAIFS